MLPRRKLSEIFTSAQLSRSFSNVLVEGPTDHIILRSFCEGAHLAVVIYPITSVEVDGVSEVLGGNKGRLIAVSELASARNQRRLFCVVDRDNMQCDTVELNSHCYLTDLSCLEMYALDIQELQGYLQRQFQFDCSLDAFLSVIRTAWRASWLHWRKTAQIDGVSLANIDRSLSVRDCTVSVDLLDWVLRSRVRGGSSEAWDQLASEASQVGGPEGDPKRAISIHKFDDVLRFWLRQAAGASVSPGWLEGHLRGLASYDRLSKHSFFEAIQRRCIEELR